MLTTDFHLNYTVSQLNSLGSLVPITPIVPELLSEEQVKQDDAREQLYAQRYMHTHYISLLNTYLSQP